jgi:hypothetical protein
MTDPDVEFQHEVLWDKSISLMALLKLSVIIDHYGSKSELHDSFWLKMEISKFQPKRA